METLLLCVASVALGYCIGFAQEISIRIAGFIGVIAIQIIVWFA